MGDAVEEVGLLLPPLSDEKVRRGLADGEGDRQMEGCKAATGHFIGVE